MPKTPNAISLRRQLLRGLLAPLLPILLISVVAAYFTAYHFANLAYDRALLRAVLSLADQVVVVRGRVTVDLPQAAFDMLEYDRDDWRYYKVSGPDGELVTGYRDLPPPPQTVLPEQHAYYTVNVEDQEVRVAAYYLPLKGTSARGAALVQVGETMTKRDRMAQDIIVAMLAPLLLIVGLVTFLVWKGVGRGLAPLDALRHELGTRSYRDLSPLSTADSPKEVQPMLRAMNDLMQRLAQAISQQQRFVADASHQLRTPLAGLKTQAELALRETDMAKIHHALQQIQASSGRLSHLINQLLMLARVEPGNDACPTLVPLALDALARKTTADWVSAALAKYIDLGFDAPAQAIQVRGDAVLLGELLGNLLDNAIRYTPPGGRVTVDVREENGSPMLTVEDNGPGIPEAERERVFERFHRILGTDEEGCGLGLAIVREIAQWHQARITLNSGAAGIGTRVSIVFPLLPDA
ncbi:MAG: sensor histidine kinase [Nitrosomonadales bacterium]|nr:MAG: sensor histidine kinase [Nitrosomonadales bacterium]